MICALLRAQLEPVEISPNQNRPSDKIREDWAIFRRGECLCIVPDQGELLGNRRFNSCLLLSASRRPNGGKRSQRHHEQRLTDRHE